MTLNNREWAIVIWVFISLIYLLCNPKTRSLKPNLFNIMKVMVSTPLITIQCWMIAYVIGTVYLLNKVNLWHAAQLKETLIWFGATAWLSFFNLNKYQQSSHYFKDFTFSNFKLLAVVSFVISIHTFSLAVEILLTPCLFFLGLLIAFSQTDDKYKSVNTLLSNVAGLYVLSLIAFTFYQASKDIDSFANSNNLYSFLVPAFLTVLYIPFIFFMVYQLNIERIDKRLRIFIKDKHLLAYAKYCGKTHFSWRYKFLERWLSSLAYTNFRTKDDVDRSINDVYDYHKLENTPPPVNTNRGWSPFDAMQFLKVLGVEARNYHPTYDNEWVARSSYIEIGATKNKIIFYVFGIRSLATSLELNLNISSVEMLLEAHQQMHVLAKEIINTALDRDIPHELATNILEGTDCNYLVGHYQIEYQLVRWANEAVNGYDLELRIKLID